MCDLFLFKRAYADYEVAAMVASFKRDDELIINSIAYNLQQAVEKVLKGFLTINGTTVGYTHEISKLITMSMNNGSPCVITPWIDDHKYEIENWEAKSRYIKNFTAELSNVQIGMSEIKNFMKLNGVCKTLLPEVTDSVKEALKSRIPLNDLPEDNMEWNILYIAFRKKLKLLEKKTEYVDFDLGKYCKMLGIKDIQTEIKRLKAVYQTDDINEVKRKLKEAMKRFNA